MLMAAIIFIGSGIGGVMRYGVNVAAARLLGVDFPWATFAVNVVGSFLMGALAAWFMARANLPGTAEWRLFLTTGVLGGFTTFSAFSLDTIYLWERGAAFTSLIYVAASLVLSLLALMAGLWLVRGLVG